MPAAELLKQSSYFQFQGDAFLQALSDRCAPRDVADGEVLIKEGDHVDSMFIVEDGTLKRVKSSPGSDETYVVDVVSPGSTVGLLHLFKADMADPAFATIVSDGKSKVWELGRKDLLDLLRSNPEYALDMGNAMAHQLRQNSKIIRELHSKSGAGPSFQGIKVLSYDSSAWVRTNFSKFAEAHNQKSPPHLQVAFDYTNDNLNDHTVTSAAGYEAVCLFVNDVGDADVLKSLSALGVRMVALRCAGFDRIDKGMAEALQVTVARVPAYSPYAVAEHGVALLMALNRKIHRAITRVKDGNFILDGLQGFDLHGKTVGVMGTGKIGQCLCNILVGFGVNLICYDMHQAQSVKDQGGKYVEPDELWRTSDVVFLMTPLFDSTFHMFNESVVKKIKRGMILVNTSRGGLVDTQALIHGLRSGAVGGAGLDVYENEGGYFFKDCSDRPIEDPVLMELMSFNNVILTAHQAFFTQEAINNIVTTTISNIVDYKEGKEGKAHPNSIY